ncbi:MAG: hypothetical protein KIG65_00055 [Eubacteriales bacterium]|nr:hypothetical protein [Eubacteriales bacterium]
MIIKKRYMNGKNRGYLYSAIGRQIARCHFYENYKAGIIVACDEGKLHSVSGIAKTIITRDDADYRPLTTSLHEVVIPFTNGSCLRIIKPFKNKRNCQFNDILYDNSLDNETINGFIKPMYTAYEENFNQKDFMMRFTGFDLCEY